MITGLAFLWLMVALGMACDNFIAVLIVYSGILVISWVLFIMMVVGRAAVMC